MVVDVIRAVLARELRAVAREVAAYPSDALLWRAVPGLPNPGGTLALHVAGNLAHYVGAVLGGTGYVRDRDAEFSTRGLSRAEVGARVDAAAAAVEATLAAFPPARLDADYPEEVVGRRVRTGDFLVHLVSHLGYHLGQLDYHRRMLAPESGGAETISLRELRESSAPGAAGSVDSSGDSLLSRAVWDGGDLPLMELASLWRTAHGYGLRGSVVGQLGGSPLAVRYVVDCGPDWRTRVVRVEVTDASAARAIELRVDEGGRWRVDGAERPELEGVADVDIQVTPSTNTLPVRRLGLGIGEEREVTAAWIRFPELTVSPLRQTYRRVGEREYEYRSADFRADLRFDAAGLIESYGTYWRRVGGGDP